MEAKRKMRKKGNIIKKIPLASRVTKGIIIKRWD